MRLNQLAALAVVRYLAAVAVLICYLVALVAVAAIAGAPLPFSDTLIGMCGAFVVSGFLWPSKIQAAALAEWLESIANNEQDRG